MPHPIGTIAEGKQAAVLVTSIRIANPLFIQTAGNTLHSHGAPTVPWRMLTGSQQCCDAHPHGPAPAPNRVTRLHPLALLLLLKFCKYSLKGQAQLPDWVIRAARTRDAKLGVGESFVHGFEVLDNVVSSHFTRQKI